MPRSTTKIPTPQHLIGSSERMFYRYQQQQMQVQGFEKEPPRCGNCSHFNQAKPFNVRPDLRKWSPNYCKLGSFACEAYSICDSWLGLDGSILEK